MAKDKYEFKVAFGQCGAAPKERARARVTAEVPDNQRQEYEDHLLRAQLKVRLVHSPPGADVAGQETVAGAEANPPDIFEAVMESGRLSVDTDSIAVTLVTPDEDGRALALTPFAFKSGTMYSQRTGNASKKDEDED
jgi:hypothetical protein